MAEQERDQSRQTETESEAIVRVLTENASRGDSPPDHSSMVELQATSVRQPMDYWRINDACKNCAVALYRQGKNDLAIEYLKFAASFRFASPEIHGFGEGLLTEENEAKAAYIATQLRDAYRGREVIPDRVTELLKWKAHSQNEYFLMRSVAAEYALRLVREDNDILAEDYLRFAVSVETAKEASMGIPEGKLGTSVSKEELRALACQQLLGGSDYIQFETPDGFVSIRESSLENKQGKIFRSEESGWLVSFTPTSAETDNLSEITEVTFAVSASGETTQVTGSGHFDHRPVEELLQAAAQGAPVL